MPGKIKLLPLGMLDKLKTALNVSTVFTQRIGTGVASLSKTWRQEGIF